MLLKFPDETGFEDFSTHLLYVVRLEFQPDSSKTSQELALISDIPVERPDIEIFSQANEALSGSAFMIFPLRTSL